MTHRLYKIEISLSIQAISKEVHGCAARRVKTYGIPVKLRILPPDVRSENEPFRPDTHEVLKGRSPELALLRHDIIGVRLLTNARRAKMPK